MSQNRRVKLTDKGIDRRRAPAAGRIELWDAETPGFGLRLTAGGVKAFQVMFRVKGNGKLRRLTLGRYCPASEVAARPKDADLGGYLTLAQARAKARQMISDARTGIDPEEAERDKAAERARAKAHAFAAVREQFLDLYARPKNKSWKQAAAYLRRDFAAWDSKPIGAITRRDVIAVLDKKSRTGGPIAANRLLAHVRKLFNWAASRDLITASPIVNIARPAAEVERERVLTDGEIKRIWDSSEKLSWPFGAMFKLMLITGQRRDEVAGMRWIDIKPHAIDAEATNSFVPVEWVWHLGGDQTKAGRSHDVPLSDLAMQVISTIPRFQSQFLFPARGKADRYATGFSKAKANCDKLCGFDDWRVHDLRRTAGTSMASLGIAVSTISRVLNHAEGGVTKIYNRYSYHGEKRAALDAWAKKLAGTVGVAQPESVVDLVEQRGKRVVSA
jgi:integrase